MELKELFIKNVLLRETEEMKIQHSGDIYNLQFNNFGHLEIFEIYFDGCFVKSGFVVAPDFYFSEEMIQIINNNGGVFLSSSLPIYPRYGNNLKEFLIYLEKNNINKPDIEIRINKPNGQILVLKI